ncbi:MAG TPA: oligopeptide/dipeptide ABC transporter ATP-binding protein [Terriglobales bacterium]|nr:oligopeptide/dipeptide ABC transporter ATP-binding protein [Terriglobales bacterium]
MLFVSHDLLSVAAICDRIAIIHDGEIVETGETERIFMRPQHPYTQQLVAALPAQPAFKQRNVAKIAAT